MHRSRQATTTISLLVMIATYLAADGAKAQGRDIIDLQNRLDTFQPQPVPEPVTAPVVPVTRTEPVYDTVEEKVEKPTEELATLLQNEIEAKTQVPAAPEGQSLVEAKPKLTGLSDAQVRILAEALGLDSTAMSIDGAEAFVPEASQQAQDAFYRRQIPSITYSQILGRGRQSIVTALVGGMGFPANIGFRTIFKRQRVGTREVTDFVRGKRKTQLHFESASEYSYTSNAFTRSFDPVSDMLFAPNANLVLSIPIGPNEDTLSFTGGSSFARYDDSTSLDDDTIQASASYFMGIDRMLRHQSMKENLVIAFDTSSTYAPGFEGTPTSFYIPSVTWSRSGIPFGNAICPTDADPKNRCNKFAVTLGSRYTWSNNSGLDNMYASARATYSRSFKSNKKVGLSAWARMSGTHYVRFPGEERNELQFDGDLSVNYTDGPVVVSGGINYTHRTSSIDSLTYDRFRAVPKVAVRILLGTMPK